MERETTHVLWDREGAYNRLLNDEALLQKMMHQAEHKHLLLEKLQLQVQ